MAIESDIGPVMGAFDRSRSDDEAIAILAASQHGLVAREQLLAGGMGRRAIAHRIERGRLHVVHRGVYAVGHRVVSLRGAWMAAVLAAGPGAVLSHRSAAALWGIRDTARARPEVTASRQKRHPRIDTYRARLPADEVDARDGIPLTTPARTLFDLAAILEPHQLERAIDEAERRRLGSSLPLGALLARHAGERGVVALRTILQAGDIGRYETRSHLEARFLAFLDVHRLPRPTTNRSLDGGDARQRIPDCVWSEPRLVVELDGFETHGTRSAFEADRARDRALQAVGYRVVRITSRQLDRDADTIARQLRTLLEGAAPRSR